ncbi:hypothetical protein NMG60_11017733 [Bertholletia excelsa]
MALSGVCFVPLKLHLPPPRLPFSSSSKSEVDSSSSYPQRTRKGESNDPNPLLCLNRKRMLNFSIAIAVVILSSPIPCVSKVLAEDLELERYTDSKDGFTLLLPHSWIKVDKAGATVLFEEPNKSGNNIGVVVNPVRIMNLQEFGTPEFVADKLIQAEKRKESTKEAEIITVSKRSSGKGDQQVYQFEYKVDSTRGGMKRIFSAVFVSSGKLYILNIAHSEKPDSPLDMHRRRVLEQVLHSFDAVA